MQSLCSQQQVKIAVLTMEHGSTNKTFLPRSIRIVTSSALMLSADGRVLTGSANGTHWGAGEESAAKDAEVDAIKGLKTPVGFHDGLTEATKLLQPTEDAGRGPHLQRACALYSNGCNSPHQHPLHAKSVSSSDAWFPAADAASSSCHLQRLHAAQ